MRLLKVLFLVLAIAFSGSYRVEAQTTNYKNYAIFVYNFLKYASWPDDAERTTIEVAIYGTTKVSPELIELIKDKKPNGKTVVIKQTNQINQIGSPQVLFIADAKSSELKSIVDATAGKNILILTEREELIKRGA